MALRLPWTRRKYWQEYGSGQRGGVEGDGFCGQTWYSCTRRLSNLRWSIFGVVEHRGRNQKMFTFRIQLFVPLILWFHFRLNQGFLKCSTCLWFKLSKRIRIPHSTSTANSAPTRSHFTKSAPPHTNQPVHANSAAALC
jgi:hypothetical protein